MVKKLIAAILPLILLVGICLTSCDEGEKALAIYPAYTGDPVTTTDREFTKDDFYVLANYADHDETIDDYEFEMVGFSEGYYEIWFYYGELSNPLYIKCEIPIYPSEMADAE